MTRGVITERYPDWKILWAVLVFMLAVAPARVLAASAAEMREYGVALRFFQDSKYDLAEKELADFVKKHGGSDKVPEAVLLQAQCRYEEKQYESAVLLLRERLADAGPLTDQYRYWLAESLFHLGNYTDAARTFSQLLAEFPASTNRLEAGVGEAFSYYKLGDLKRTLDLLRNPNGSFQRAAASRPDDDSAVRGDLLLIEVGLSLNDLKVGEETLERLAGQTLRPELSWRRQYLLARLQLRREQLDSALRTSAELLAQLDSITNAASTALRPDVVALQGRVQEMKGDTDGAIKTYQLNLGTNVPAEQRQQAVQRVVELTLAQNRFGEAASRLEPFVRQNATDPALDILRLALGELRLKEYYQLSELARTADTNFLRLAGVHFDQVLASTNAQLAPKAQLDRGWCLWEEARGKGDTNKLREGLLAFEAAATQSPRGRDQAVARFKTADCLFSLGNYSGAIENYRAVITNYSELAVVKEALVPQALYQLVRAAIASGDSDNAEKAVEQIVADYPESTFADRTALLYGEAVNRLKDPAAARAFFTDFLSRFPKASLAPEIQLAIARTFEQQSDWPKAIHEYDAWVTHHPGHASLPQAEFGRAWANDLGGNETNAFNLFTHLVAQFQANPLTALAQHWIAVYHYNHEQFDLAEFDFQKIFQSTNWPPTALTYQSRLAAGRAAFRRQGYSAAVGYFTNLINDASCPPALLPETYFALADAFIRYSEATGTATNSFDNYKQAVAVLEKIIANYPTNRLVPMAWGRMGDCYFQRASTDPRFYTSAAEAYTNAMTSNSAEIATRSDAEVGLAQLREKQAKQAPPTEPAQLLNQALAHYLNVVEGKNLRDNEEASPFWVKRAAVEAARLAEEQQQWEVARNLYARLKAIVPSLRQTWEARLERLKQLRGEPDSSTTNQSK